MLATSARERQILDATLALVESEGLQKTSLSKISKQANCSPGIIYHYFQSKDEILDDITLEQIAERVCRSVLV